MDFKKQLPYLGEEQKDGSIFLLNFQIFRPDYENFFQEKFQTEANCVAILLGVSNPNHLHYEIDKKLNSYLIGSKGNENIPFVDFFQELDSLGEDFYDLSYIFNELKKRMDLSIANKDLKQIKLKSDPFSKIKVPYYFFSEYRINYIAKDFLKWAKGAGYKIPKEVESAFQNETTDISILKNKKATSKPYHKVKDLKISTESFIKNLTIRYEDDKTISIQEPKKPKKEVSANDLGFTIHKQGKNLTWEEFLNILQNTPNHYYTIKFGSDRKRMEAVSRKLLNYFQKKFDLAFPTNYKLHELDKTKEPGTYRFKFKIEYKDTEDKDSSSKATFRKKFFFKIETWENTHDNNSFKKIKEMAGTGLKRGFLTKEEITNSLAPEKSINEEFPNLSKEQRFYGISKPEKK